jgi:arabinose-5-phosphate isomerase
MKEDRPVSRETARRVIEIESQALADLAARLDDSFDGALDLLTGCEGRVIVTGMGKSGIVAQKIAATLSSTGRPAYFMHPAEALHGDLGMIVAGDVLLALSNSGETGEIVRLLELVRRLGARIIGMSGRPDSSLAKFADIFLDVGVNQEACSLDLLPTASTSAAMAMGDALAVACYERRGFSSSDFARYHPGGRLGRKLLLVENLMHSGDELPVVRGSESIEAAVREMDRKKLGMTCVVDEAGHLSGVLTDGDLRRRMLATPSPMSGMATDAMVRTPTTISPDALATEALKIMEDKKNTSLPVVDSAGLLLGVIQIHDLWRTELF